LLRKCGASPKIVPVAFDLLYLDGYNLRPDINAYANGDTLIFSVADRQDVDVFLELSSPNRFYRAFRWLLVFALCEIDLGA
jgi:hypothetical protein